MQNKILKHVLFHDNNASAALYNPLRNMSGLGVAEMETPPPPQNPGPGLRGLAWHGELDGATSSDSGRWWVSPRCCLQGCWAGERRRRAPRIRPLIGPRLFWCHRQTEEALTCSWSTLLFLLGHSEALSIMGWISVICQSSSQSAICEL